MKQRKRLSRSSSKKKFRSGTKVHKRNNRVSVMRGGYRI